MLIFGTVIFAFFMCNEVIFFNVFFFLLLKIIFPGSEDLTDNDPLSKTVDILYHYFKMQHSREKCALPENWKLNLTSCRADSRSLCVWSGVSTSRLNTSWGLHDTKHKTKIE